MAVDYQISAPCLLDDLMDDEIVKYDIDFGGVAVGELGPFAAKGSPSRESDSGCSDMSVRSVSPSDIGVADIGDENIVDFQSFDFLSDDTDGELASYFTNPAAKSPENVVSVPSVITSLSSRMRASTRQSVEDDLCLSSDVDSECDPEYKPKACLRMLRSKGKSVVHSKGKTISNKSGIAETDIRVLPSSSNSVDHLDVNNNSRVPAVKVVKVIKAPAFSSKQDVDKQLLEALDVRNKKNAVQAKINREKKKAYVKELEEEIDTLKTENYAVKENNRKILKERNALAGEVEYLRSVLANDSALAGLLGNIGNVNNLKLSSSFSRKRNAERDHDYESPSKRVKQKQAPAGVCLHVDQGSVSLEFCSKCANMASTSTETSNS